MEVMEGRPVVLAGGQSLCSQDRIVVVLLLVCMKAPQITLRCCASTFLHALKVHKVAVSHNTFNARFNRSRTAPVLANLIPVCCSTPDFNVCSLPCPA
eukprot:5024064-Pleurochrysis_carterae.AAC.1